MRFRLLYDGYLPSGDSKGSASVKHQIRKVLHKQLIELWKNHPFLKNFYTGQTPRRWVAGEEPSEERVSVMYKMADKFERCGYRFLPLVRNTSGVAVSLDILFLRRGEAGRLVSSGGGDIDNRIKTLFDALKMPQHCQEVVGPPDADEDPFLCLLEDDSLITEFKVTTDRLLTPLEEGGYENNVRLIIHVKTLVVRQDTDTWDLFKFD
jgi:hypothetical protein